MKVTIRTTKAGEDARTIKKGAATYSVREYKTVWGLVRKAGRVTIRFSVPKAQSPDFEALQAYVLESDLF